jgi:hypothetical protein
MDFGKMSNAMIEYFMMMPVDRLPMNPPPDPRILEVGNVIKKCINDGVIKNFRLDSDGIIQYDLY